RPEGVAHLLENHLRVVVDQQQAGHTHLWGVAPRATSAAGVVKTTLRARVDYSILCVPPAESARRPEGGGAAIARPVHDPWTPPLPENEAERLAALRAVGVLDPPPEPAFDELAGLAAYICQTPVALISLVDEDRQWFKSRVGWAAAESSREAAFCARTILQPD